MNDRERADFERYLRACTDRQVSGVYWKERYAKRYSYSRLAKDEAARRGIRIASTLDELRA